MTRDVRRYSEIADDVSPEKAYMRALIRTERKDDPSDATMLEIATRLGPILTSGRTSARASSIGLPLSFVAVIAGALIVGAYGLRSRMDNDDPPPSVTATESLADARKEIGRGIDVTPENRPASSSQLVPTLSVELLPKASPSARVASSAARPNCTNEVELLERADAALRSNDAARALAITREHVARCPTGSFVQERERIAIEALARLGQATEMRQRALVFEERYPASPHLRLIRKLLQEHRE